MSRPPEHVRRVRPAGFSLVEVLIALVVLEVGLLGVAGMALLAQRRMAEAAERVRAVGAAEALADSLLAAEVKAPRAGEAVASGFRLWWVVEDRGVRVEVVPSEGEVHRPIYWLEAMSGGTS